MEGVTGMVARLGHVPGCSWAGLYGPANIDFRFVYELRLQQAARQTEFTRQQAGFTRPLPAKITRRLVKRH